MQPPDLFECAEPRLFLRIWLEASGDQPGMRASIARAAGWSAAQIKNASAGRRDLRQDMAQGLIRAMNLGPEETEGFSLLVALGCARPELRAPLLARFEQLRSRWKGEPAPLPSPPDPQALIPALRALIAVLPIPITPQHGRVLRPRALPTQTFRALRALRSGASPFQARSPSASESPADAGPEHLRFQLQTLADARRALHELAEPRRLLWAETYALRASLLPAVMDVVAEYLRQVMSLFRAADVSRASGKLTLDGANPIMVFHSFVAVSAISTQEGGHRPSGEQKTRITRKKRKSSGPRSRRRDPDGA